MLLILFISDQKITCARCQPYNKNLKTQLDEVHEVSSQSSLIVTSSKASAGKRKNCCPFCMTLITNFSRHVKLPHSEEEEVKKYLAVMDEDPKERRVKRAMICNSLRKKGNNLFNLKVVEKKISSELMPVKRSSNNRFLINNISHVTCIHCLGLFKKENLYRHLKKCLLNNEIDVAANHKNLVLKNNAKLLVPSNPDASEILKNEVYPNMLKDEVAVIVQSDPLITKFGTRFHNTHRGTNQIHYCSSKMRSLAKLFLTIKKLNPDLQTFKDCLKPQNFDYLVEAVRRMSAFNLKTGDSGTPSVPARLCSSLKSCADIICSEAIKNPSLSSDEKKQILCQISDFHHLMRKDWANEVSANCEKSRRKQKVLKEDILPDPEDIRLFSKFLNDLCISEIKHLKSVPDEKNYENLAKTIISYIITLNRRRPGEVVDITLDNYKTVDINNDYGLLDETVLTDEEKKTGMELSIFYIAANKNKKKVPVLLTKIMKEGIDTLLETRKEVGVKNELLFGRPGGKEKFDGTVVLRELKNKANLKKPDHFTATGLRHHAATSSQLHSRNDSYCKRLAKFLGHDLATHENYYEMPLPLVQKAVVGNQLIKMTLPRPLTEKKLEQSQSKAVHRLSTKSKSAIQSNASSGEEDSPSKGKRSDSDFVPSELEEDSLITPETPPRKHYKKIRWSVAEKEAVYQRFGKYFILNIKPCRKEIKKVWEEEKILKNRTLEQVITYVNNISWNKLTIPSPVRIRIKKRYLQSTD